MKGTAFRNFPAVRPIVDANRLWCIEFLRRITVFQSIRQVAIQRFSRRSRPINRVNNLRTENVHRGVPKINESGKFRGPFLNVFLDLLCISAFECIVAIGEQGRPCQVFCAIVSLGVLESLFGFGQNIRPEGSTRDPRIQKRIGNVLTIFLVGQ